MVLSGKGSELKKVKTADVGDIYGSGAHGKEEMVIAVEKDGYQKPVGAEKAQTKWFISEGNGGESRKVRPMQ